MKKFTLTLFVTLLAGIQVVLAQNIRVTGKVSDASGSPMVGVTVVVDGTTRGTTTLHDGTYAISAPAGGTLQYTFVGMVPMEVAVNNRTVINVTMESDTEMIDNVVVVAYGTTPREALTGAVSQVGGDQISKQQVSSATKALEGMVPGLQLVSSTGQPGSDGGIFIRGVGSFSAEKKALIVVDGAPYNGDLSEINPSDIESMSVSKDATSNSLYGARAANGVVFVTTKKGRSLRPQISFKAVIGMNDRGVPDYDMITDPGEHMEMLWKGLRNSYWSRDAANGGGDLVAAGQYATGQLLAETGGYNPFKVTGDLVDPVTGKLNPNASLMYDDTFADAMFSTSMRQEYMFSASGGSERTNYYTSFGYLNDDSYVTASGFERYTGRVNLESKLKDWFKLGVNLSYSRVNSNEVNEGENAASNAFNTARQWASIYPVYARDANGNIKTDEDGNWLYDWGTPGETDGTTGRPAGQNQNTIASMKNDFRDKTRNTVNALAYMEFYFLKDFTFRAELTQYYQDYKYDLFLSPLGGDGKNFNGRLTHYNYVYNTTNLVQRLNYNKTINKHSIAVLLGHEFNTYTRDYKASQKTNFFDPELPNFNNGGDMQYIQGYDLEHNIEGYFAQASYNYDNKYFVNASVRRDGTSRFRYNKWGTFWSVGAAWRIGEENFMLSTRNWLNELKLRSSYGSQGMENIGGTSSYYPYTDQYGVDYDGTNFSTPIAYYGNPNLSWENQYMFNVGLDFRLFGRLTGSFEYYHRKTDDVLFQRSLAISSGRQYQWENDGKLINQGIEFELSYNIFNRPDLQWNVGLNGWHNRGKTVHLPEQYKGSDPFNDGRVSGYQKNLEGEPLYNWYLQRYAGVNPQNGKSQWYRRVEETDASGNVTYKEELTEDFNNATRYFMDKTAQPDFVGGFNTSFYYKGIDFSVITSFQLGGWVLDLPYAGTMGASFISAKHKDLWNSWDPTNPDSGTNIPIHSGDNGASQISDRYLIKASYFNLRNITLGYTFPQKWMDRIGVASMRLYVTSDNVWLSSKRKGFDPRTTLTGELRGTDYSAYSAIRTTSVGIDIKF